MNALRAVRVCYNAVAVRSSVSSSEKVDKEERYSSFDLLSLPYPGCEFFQQYCQRGYQADGLRFDWTQSYIDVEVGLPAPLSCQLQIPWPQYRVRQSAAPAPSHAVTGVRYPGIPALEAAECPVQFPRPLVSGLLAFQWVSMVVCSVFASVCFCLYSPWYILAPLSFSGHSVCRVACWVAVISTILLEGIGDVLETDPCRGSAHRAGLGPGDGCH